MGSRNDRPCLVLNLYVVRQWEPQVVIDQTLPPQIDGNDDRNNVDRIFHLVGVSSDLRTWVVNLLFRYNVQGLEFSTIILSV